VSAVLVVGVRLRTATVPLATDALSAGERAAWRRLPEEGPRRRDWLLGRAALKPLVDGADTAAVAFPHPRLSLTHSGPMAVAVSVDSDNAPAGVGVDLETRSGADPRAARFFLHDDEEASEPHDVLRLWTVKEALYKATPANAGGRLLDYRVVDPSASNGSATDITGRTFRYASGLLDRYRLTVAVCLGDTRAAV
jgi:hypothetical protein